MIYLLFSVLFATVLFIILKLFSRFGINTLQALVVNYATAASLGFFLFPEKISFQILFEKEWAPHSLILGCLFISVFYIMAMTSQKNGVGVAAIATKMSVIIPISAGIILYKEQLLPLTVLGIVLALVSVYLTIRKDTPSSAVKTFIYPLLAFFGAGIIDSFIKYIQAHFLSDSETILFSAYTFFTAFLAGFFLVAYRIISGKASFDKKSIIGGIVLGIPNFGSLYFMIKMLESGLYSSAVLFTINNIAIVMLSALAGFFIFRERLSLYNLIGIALAIVSLFMVTYGH